MGFFKDIGKKIKRVVSIKNVINGVTGQWTALGKDVLRVATTKAPVKAGAGTTVDNTSFLGQQSQGFEISPTMDAILTDKGQQFAKKTAEIIGATPTATGVSDWFTKAYISAMWLKYKKYILIALGVIVAFFVWKRFSKPVKRARR